VVMLWTGFNQHYGGLDEVRRYVRSQPGWENLPAEHLKRIASNRIFATLLYPNTLAGVILLLTPVLAVGIWDLTSWLTPVTRAVLTGLFIYASVACLYWSGSKAGWLISLIMATVGLFQVTFPRRLKVAILAVLLVAGMAGFFVKFQSYFAKGATSVGARFQYWRASAITAVRHPVLGTGPGTFSVTYRQLKPPEAEMARLTHNDYLEQASDSGLPGALFFTGFVLGSVGWLYRAARTSTFHFAVWVGLFGWALQSFVEFGLYIPAVGWLAFGLLGWLWGDLFPRRLSGPDHRS